MTMTGLMPLFGPRTSNGNGPIPPIDLQLVGERVILALGHPRDWNAWRKVREESQDFLSPWEPTWPADGLTFDFFSRTLRRQWKEWKEGSGFTFLVFLADLEGAAMEDENAQLVPEKTERSRESFSSFGRRALTKTGTPKTKIKRGALIGGVSLTDIRRGAAQHGTLGYWIGQPFSAQGLMKEAASLVTSFGFETLKLHRIEASCMPHNEPSRRLLASLGFQLEGFAPSYLRINGAWEDHEIWGKLAI